MDILIDHVVSLRGSDWSSRCLLIFIPVLLLKKKSCNYLYLTNLHVNTTSIKDRKSKLFPRFQILCIFCIAFLLYDLKAGLSFPDDSDGKESAYNAGDPGLIPGSGRSSGEGNGYPFQYSCLENPMDRRAWLVTVHEVTAVWHDWVTNSTVNCSTVNCRVWCV